MANDVQAWLDRAEQFRQMKAENLQNYPDATPATPTMERLIAWADIHESKIRNAKAGKKTEALSVAEEELAKRGFNTQSL